MTERMFRHIVGIDYSGAKHALAGLPGVRVFWSQTGQPAQEVSPPAGSASKYWTRRGLAIWLHEFLAANEGALIGIDHAFSFPQAYFEAQALRHSWDAFLEDFCTHWPLTERLTVDDIRKAHGQSSASRLGNPRWRRITERSAKTAKSVFHFDVQGSVAKSTHAGLPWLFHLRQALKHRLHIWPFDGWEIPKGQSVLAEVYPRLWSGLYEQGEKTQDQHDAYCVATWLAETDGNQGLKSYFSPQLSDIDRATAGYEGWILGVLPAPAAPQDSKNKRLRI